MHVMSQEEALALNTADENISAVDLTNACANRLWAAKADFETAMRTAKLDDGQVNTILRTLALFERLIESAGLDERLQHQRGLARAGITSNKV